jgi:hypothetical protein
LNYLSDVNLRAVLHVLVCRAGGEIEISNSELYDAMLPQGGQRDRFEVLEVDGGLRIVAEVEPSS